MPPRKHTASVVSTTPKSPSGALGDASILSTTSATSAEAKSLTTHKTNRHSTGIEVDTEKVERKKAKSDDIGIDDLLLPRTLTSRLSRGTLPPNTSIQRDALLALAKSATVFISYIVHNANNLTPRKTVQAADILEALKETELWNVNIGGGGQLTLGERVQAEYEKWEEDVKGKRKGYRDRVKARESTNTNPVVDGEGETDAEGEGRSRGPKAKRIRREDETEGDTTMDVGPEADDDDEESEDTAAAAQLRDEEAAANGDETETDQWATAEDDGEDEEEEAEEGDEDEDDEVDEDENENDDEDEDDEDDEHDDTDEERAPRRTRMDADGAEVYEGDDDNDDAAQRRRRRTALAPNGRVEVGSDEDSD